MSRSDVEIVVSGNAVAEVDGHALSKGPHLNHQQSTVTIALQPRTQPDVVALCAVEAWNQMERRLELHCALTLLFAD
jgi:hypothetical protein